MFKIPTHLELDNHATIHALCHLQALVSACCYWLCASCHLSPVFLSAYALSKLSPALVSLHSPLHSPYCSGNPDILYFSFITMRKSCIDITDSIFQTSMVMSAYMTVSLTVERYISVVHPLLAIRHQSTRFCIFLASLGLIFSILFTLPNYFLLEIQYVHDNLSSSEDINILELISNQSLFNSADQTPSPRVQLVWVTWRNNQAFTTVSWTFKKELIRKNI